MLNPQFHFAVVRELQAALLREADIERQLREARAAQPHSHILNRLVGWLVRQLRAGTPRPASITPKIVIRRPAAAARGH